MRHLFHYKNILISIVLIIPITPFTLHAMDGRQNPYKAPVTVMGGLAIIFQTYCTIGKYLVTSPDCFKSFPDCPNQQEFLTMDALSLAFNVGFILAAVKIIGNYRWR